ncbi:SH3 beta-barrel fold-containing protein [Antarcticibacterium sp. 1MA-6-2]|uniref:SH3 beta-barrel fold-containing protein n=1 Tax=Antarcticibacterium sp. 1MA-6-2 TaxID=2908210 RepID=UPI001F290487|nr:SH3 beta-barrel fold-containing protein [Antarcticibacterium sp. 1MA-6-2]UJH91682.1 SH3 beta-barrel fold-containing protein [Antarcticibacterium sp. 1MA-6-2]
METSNKTFRTRVFKWAHELVKSTGKSFAVCLAKAWALYRLRKRMATETVKIAFEKADGSLRIAYATLKNAAEKIKGTSTPNYKTVTYFDAEVNSLRSFKVENFIAAY